MTSGVNTATSRKLVDPKQYDKLSLLGSGGFGSVFLVDGPGSQKFAMKEIYIRQGSNAANSARIAKFIDREIDLLAKLTKECPTDCPIIRYIGSADDTSSLPHKKSIVMELANGGDLNSHLVSILTKAKDANQVKQMKLKLADEILAGLLFIHEKQIVHGDIKPDNILIHDGRVKYSDFGLACLNSDCDHVAGTISHLDPRIIRGKVKKVSFETDMYSLGVMLYNIFEVGEYIQQKRFYFDKDYIDNYAIKKFAMEAVVDTLTITGNNKLGRYYQLMIRLLDPLLEHPAEHRPTIQDALKFVQGGGPLLPSYATSATSAPSLPTNSMSPTTMSPGTPSQGSEDDIRRRVENVVDIVIEDLVTFGDSGVPTNSQARAELGKSIYKPLLNGIALERIQEIVGSVLASKLNELKGGGGGRQLPNLKKTDKKVKIAGKYRCVYIDSKRKQFVKLNGVMVPKANLPKANLPKANLPKANVPKATR